MSERVLITKLVRRGNLAELYGRGHQYRDLILWDLSDLAEVGIDYAGLEEGRETPCRFWAVYELSEKLNRAGNPYRNVVALERHDVEATPTLGLAADVARIRALVERLVSAGEDAVGPAPDPAEGAACPPPPFPPAPPPEPCYANGSPLGKGEAEQRAFAAYVDRVGAPPASVDALRQWVWEARDMAAGV